MQVGARLYRSRSDRMISGVAGGMAKYFDVDPALVRLLWVVVGFTTGVGIVAYIAAAIIVPESPISESSSGPSVSPDGDSPPDSPPASSAAQPAARAHDGKRLFGGLLVLLGATLLLQHTWRWAELDHFLGPAVLIAVGVVVFLKGLGAGK